MQSYTIIHNGTVLTPSKEIMDGVVVVEGSKIMEVGTRGEVQEPSDAQVIDAGGKYILPGLIDIHVHGSKGADVLDSTPEALETMSQFFITHGVTAFVGTMITAPPEMLLAGLENVRSVINNGGLSGAELIGAHQEGPFLNPAEKGAHPEELLVLPEPEHYEQYLEYSDVMTMMTLAPEREGAPGLIKRLREEDVIATMGHSDGITRTLMPGIDAGITHAVHCFCNMSTLRRDKLKRVCGATETILYDDRITTELIGDGWHVGDNLMKLAVKAKGIDRVCWVTDAMAAAGMPPGRYYVGDVEAIVEDGIARLPDWSAYASSVTTMDVCVRNGIERLGLSLQDSARMATLTPATVIGIEDRKGSIEKGKDADIVIIDEDVNVQLTMVRGSVLYRLE
ncbi:MAG: N-acetylglucosamine-6-phosphate deacetylase [Anaerolineales bacterium]|nr:N-acetylglucosamine-6-phosphate deacetylase [Anaerolineales bacterium]